MASIRSLLSLRLRRSGAIGLGVLLVLALTAVVGRPAPTVAPSVHSAAPTVPASGFTFEAPFVATVGPQRIVPAAASITLPTPPPVVAAPAGAGEPEPSPVPSVPFFATHRIVSYYGHPLARGMGIVGEYDPAELVRRLHNQAAVYQALDPGREVAPAIHLIFAVAQADPGGDRLYLGRMDPDLVKQWVQFTKDNGLLLFLDVQFGRSTIERELPLVLPYLAEPHVHLALDPEFKWSSTEFPNVSLGHLDAAEINKAQELLQTFMTEHDLTEKILIVHQFRRDMITHKDTITAYPGIDLVIDADGFGPPETKIAAYNAVVRDDQAPNGGFKLFYHHDPETSRLMREEEVLALDPPPVVVIYQ